MAIEFPRVLSHVMTMSLIALHTKSANVRISCFIIFLSTPIWLEYSFAMAALQAFLYCRELCQQLCSFLLCVSNRSAFVHFWHCCVVVSCGVAWRVIVR